MYFTMEFEETFPITYARIPAGIREEILAPWRGTDFLEASIEKLVSLLDVPTLPPYLSEVARLEYQIYLVGKSTLPLPSLVESLMPNPTLRLFRSAWKNLSHLVTSGKDNPAVPPEKGEEWILIYRHLPSGQIRVDPASEADLLALKLAAEEGDTKTMAMTEGLPLQFFYQTIDQAVRKGILFRTPSKIQRKLENFPVDSVKDNIFLTSPIFTLQWHLTQACELHCRHCYDRTFRKTIPFEKSMRILDEMQVFCRIKKVRGQIAFSGGNPLLHPRFLDIYRAASQKDFSLMILGNPSERDSLEQILAIQKPIYFQVSLEGLAPHNDAVRQSGHFEKTIRFLELLKECRIYSRVMLTLTRDNLDQVLPLAEILRNKADAFFFTRLSPVGEGTHLHLPEPEDYRKFLKSYLEAMEKNPVLGMKDNLFNIYLHEENRDLFGGCAGYGCSAAFNFMALLPDGEVHACRKFPSLLGNVAGQSLLEIYDSEKARKYRAGTKACASCPIRPVCGGCLAVVHGMGLNIFEDRDPFCFFQQSL